ncbi:hypothetical protein [Halobacillus sp. K22]|uniref:hypothetical protein n=1 Tax=Halobacillus sp. K22 TaxID=3457431 RepID=UPI003FCEA560
MGSPFIKNFNYNALKKEVQAKNYVFDYKKFEVYFSTIIATILSLLLYIIVVFSNHAQLINLLNKSQGIILNTTFGLLGLLGFIISGLAIISGTISNKVTSEMIKVDAFRPLLSILFSFYFLGRFIGVTICFYIFTYFVIVLPFEFHLVSYLVLSWLLTYCLFFTIFFAVSLLGTCINVFQLSFLYSSTSSTNYNISSTDAIEEHFKDVRINTLTAILINKVGVTKEEFTDKLVALINEDCPDEYKEEVIKKAKEYYKF